MKNLIFLLLILPFFATQNIEKTNLKTGLETIVSESISDTSKVLMQGFEFEKSDGSLFKLEELKGQVILLDFWTTWCRPCIKQHKYVEKLYEDIEHPDFEIVSLNIDINKKKWMNYLEKNKWNGTHIHLDYDSKHPLLKMISKPYKHHETGKIVASVSIPQYYLIDKDGKVIEVKSIKARRLKSRINKMLSQ